MPTTHFSTEYAQYLEEHRCIYEQIRRNRQQMPEVRYLRSGINIQQQYEASSGRGMPIQHAAVELLNPFVTIEGTDYVIVKGVKVKKEEMSLLQELVYTNEYREPSKLATQQFNIEELERIYQEVIRVRRR